MAKYSDLNQDYFYLQSQELYDSLEGCHITFIEYDYPGGSTRGPPYRKYFIFELLDNHDLSRDLFQLEKSCGPVDRFYKCVAGNRVYIFEVEAIQLNPGDTYKITSINWTFVLNNNEAVYIPNVKFIVHLKAKLELVN